jgi:hypothetical protein
MKMNMQSQMTFTHGVTGFVMIKWQKGQPNPFIQLGKTNWRFSNDLQVPFSIKLDNGQKRVVTVAYEPFVREGEREECPLGAGRETPEDASLNHAHRDTFTTRSRSR